jgi:hypothetical protein
VPWCWDLDWGWLVGGAAPAEPVDPVDQPSAQPAPRVVAASFSARGADGQPVGVTAHVTTRHDLPFQERDDQLDLDVGPGDVPVELVQGNHVVYG